MFEQEPFFSRWSPRILSILRIVATFIYMAHGSQKLFGIPPSTQARPLILSLSGIAGIIEFFGGFLLLLGFLTRPVAFLVSGEMAVGYFLKHAPQGFLPLVNHGELAALFSFLYLYFFFAGGGEWSIDNWLREKRDSFAGSTEYEKTKNDETNETNQIF
ncbi:MAG: DoxX family protein [Blastocatellia bacterium]|nr:DoxX family protein [Blastocatellia bacterium]